MSSPIRAGSPSQGLIQASEEAPKPAQPSIIEQIKATAARRMRDVVPPRIISSFLLRLSIPIKGPTSPSDSDQSNSSAPKRPRPGQLDQESPQTFSRASSSSTPRKTGQKRRNSESDDESAF